MEYVDPELGHLPGITRLFQAEDWPSFASDPEKTWRALTAPGTVCVVAVDGEAVAGVAHAITDGEIASFLSILLVAGERRREGIGRRLLTEVLSRLRTERCDLLSEEEAMPFYERFALRRLPGGRLHRIDR